jgi:thiol-disulfide isomerase/thioredoxin
MRRLLASVPLLAASLVHAQPATPPPAPVGVPVAPPTPAAPAAPKPLNIGDVAPALDIANWVKGSPVKFESGKAYVVEFWATWCGPCRINIPKLTALQAKYPDKKLTIIGVSVDQGGLETVKAFVDKAGPKMEYTVALDTGGTMRDYMQAVNRGGIPYAFVIDTSGKLAWHGHPADGLELIASEVVAGKFDAKKHAERSQKFLELDKTYSQQLQEKKWDDAEKTLDEIVQVRPDLEGTLMITRFWIRSGGRGDLPGAIAYARQISANQLKDDGENLTLLADKVVGAGGLSPADQQFATELARKAVDVTKSKNPTALIIYSEALKREGKFDQAIAATQQAIDAADEPMEKRYYGDRVDELKLAKEKAAKPGETKPVEPAKP